MFPKSLALLPFLAIAGCGPTPDAPRTHDPAPDAISQPTATATEESLLTAIRHARQQAGKPALTLSPKLASLAREESNSAAASGQLPTLNPDAIRMRAGVDTVGKLQGTLKDRGPATSAGFVTYWTHDDPEILLGDWTSMGVGISKSSDGRLFAIVLLGSMGGGGGLMNPAAPPGGIMRR